ncbi:proliferating cell nuclear antigen (pcna) [Acidianus brierleyi]|uniref:DNA polymerase sliding clamp n=1 Tax=Acidianus brierleyi TaxID=41673 RepID=A0A2U9IER2_9CREN|nr:proliferating cell nuclear antigen (pcna) [Acidianus brierleyi]AWR94528.1 proliferating cell nuclear antigen (pcna) [Acidianus brierleyi]
MKVSYDDVRYFKAIIEALSRLVDEASFKIKPDGIELEAIDRAHISLIKINLPKDEFKEYDVQEDMNFGFSTQYLLKVLSTSKRKEELEIESQDVSTIIIRINGEYPRVFELRNMEVSPPELPELKIEFDVKATLKSEAFRKAVSEIATVSDVVDIIADENGIKVKSKGEAEAEVELSKDSGSIQDIEISKPIESSYSTDYLNDILVLTKLSGNTKMSFAEQKPLQLEFNTESGGSVIYLLAPQLG